MAEEAQAAPPAPAPTPIAPRYADEQAPISALDAFRMTRSSTEEPKLQQPATPPVKDDAGAGQQDPVEETEAAAPEEPSGDEETTEQADAEAEELEPIDPPSSWTKEERKHWESLPRELQESIAERERVRRADFDRRHNETHRQLQAAQQAQQAAEQARKQYEDQIPVLADQIKAAMTSEFNDVKSWDDVHRMAAEDPVRFSRWQALNQQNEAVQRERQAIQERQQTQAVESTRRYIQEQNTLFLGKAPEYADPQKSSELRTQVMDMLMDYGFSAEDIGLALQTGGSIPVHDHRLQLLLRDANQRRQGLKAVKSVKPVTKTAVVTPKPVSVQRPGVASSSKDQRSEHVKALDNRVTKTGKIRDAVALVSAIRRAQ